MPSTNYPPETEIAIRLGVAIAHRNLDVLQGLDLTDSSMMELKAVWQRIELAFSPEERVWFKEILQGKVLERQSHSHIEKLKPTIVLIRVSDLVGFSLEITGEVYRQTDGTVAVEAGNLPLYADLARQKREAFIQSAFSSSSPLVKIG